MVLFRQSLCYCFFFTHQRNLNPRHSCEMKWQRDFDRLDPSPQFLFLHGAQRGTLKNLNQSKEKL